MHFCCIQYHFFHLFTETSPSLLRNVSNRAHNGWVHFTNCIRQYHCRSFSQLRLSGARVLELFKFCHEKTIPDCIFILRSSLTQCFPCSGKFLWSATVENCTYMIRLRVRITRKFERSFELDGNVLCEIFIGLVKTQTPL